MLISFIFKLYPTFTHTYLLTLKVFLFLLIILSFSLFTDSCELWILQATLVTHCSCLGRRTHISSSYFKYFKTLKLLQSIQVN